MIINHAARTITLNKKEMTAASRFGSDEYKKLQTARRDYPGFTVTTAPHKVKKQRETCKGLTYAYMEKYIKTHDDSGSIMVEFKKRCGNPINPADQLPTPYTYAENKAWFLGKYKDVAEFYGARS